MCTFPTSLCPTFVPLFVGKEREGTHLGRPLLRIDFWLLPFDYSAHGAAFLQGDAQGVGSCGQLRDVELVGVGECRHQTPGVVVDFHFQHPVSPAPGDCARAWRRFR